MRDFEHLILSIRNSAVRRGALAIESNACKEKLLKLGKRKKGWRDTRRADMRAKLHNKWTGLRWHDLTTTDLGRQTQSSTTATGLVMHPDHRHQASEVSRASKTNSRAVEPVCHNLAPNVEQLEFVSFETAEIIELWRTVCSLEAELHYFDIAEIFEIWRTVCGLKVELHSFETVKIFEIWRTVCSLEVDFITSRQWRYSRNE